LERCDDVDLISALYCVGVQDSLGGNSKVLMFVNVSPAVYNLGETLCSLNFAARCRAVELGQAKKQVTGGSSSSSTGGGTPHTPSPALSVASSGGGGGPSSPSPPLLEANSENSAFNSSSTREGGIAAAAGAGKDPISPRPMVTPLVKRASTTGASTLRK
jgi:hypothetical protein